MSTKNVTVTVASVVVAQAGYINWVQGTGTTYTVAVNAQTDYITVTDDTTAVAALAAHEADTTAIHGITNTASLSTTTIATDTLWAAKGDLAVATANDTAAVLTAPTQRKQVLGADAAGNVAWQPMHSGPAGVRISDDFFYAAATAPASGTLMGPLQVYLSGGANGVVSNAAIVNSSGNHPGVISLSTGTNATGAANLVGDGGSILLGNGRARFGVWAQVPTLSDGSQRFEFNAGFQDNYTGAAGIVDGCFFSYKDSVSVNWCVNTVANSVSTNTLGISTGIVCTAAQWYLLEVEVNAAATSVTYYIDGTSVITHTTNIPTGVGRQTTIGMTNVKSIGTTARLVYLDAYYLELDFTTAR